MQLHEAGAPESFVDFVYRGERPQRSPAQPRIPYGRSVIGERLQQDAKFGVAVEETRGRMGTGPIEMMPHGLPEGIHKGGGRLDGAASEGRILPPAHLRQGPRRARALRASARDASTRRQNPSSEPGDGGGSGTGAIVTRGFEFLNTVAGSPVSYTRAPTEGKFARASLAPAVATAPSFLATVGTAAISAHHHTVRNGPSMQVGPSRSLKGLVCPARFAGVWGNAGLPLTFRSTKHAV